MRSSALLAYVLLAALLAWPDVSVATESEVQADYILSLDALVPAGGFVCGDLPDAERQPTLLCRSAAGSRCGRPASSGAAARYRPYAHFMTCENVLDTAQGSLATAAGV